MSTDGTMAERTVERGKESLNSPSIVAFSVTRNAAKANRGTGTICLDDEENGEIADGRKLCGAVKLKDKTTDNIGNEGLNVNDGEKDAEEERHNAGKPGYAFG